HSQQEEGSQDFVNQSILYMQEHIGQSLTLEKLAAQVTVSASHYSSIFRKRSGLSPIEYFNHLKIQRACQYLQFTDMRIKEIANRIGIDDPYYFSRLFTKVMSISPKEYRDRFICKNEK
ncbi:MAG: helix-turn-helix transcriptional regulator, partial [Chitinophagaceae bacterium]|nr:helix-turn-helix transcriptional regulator [Chitinophagaceae bacterium]